MNFLITIIALSFLGLISVVCFRVCKVRQWEICVHSKICKKSDKFFGWVFLIVRGKIKDFFPLLIKFAKLLSFWAWAGVFEIRKLLVRLLKKTNRLFDNLYEKKTSNSVSAYLQNISKYK
ncbi:MAG: hypothetical protein ABIG87_03240 [Patescibacteria group bacterium]